MNTTRPSAYKSALLALGCALGCTFLVLPAVKAAELATLQPLADKVLPLTATFEKATGKDAGPQYVLKLKNDSKDAIKASAKVQLSVVVHSSDKAREVPEHVIASGETWTIGELSATDKVTVTAAGYAPLELTVP
jgi:hypothetical protein